MRIQTKLVSIDYPAAGLIYRAHESLDAMRSLHLVDDPSGCIPSFDTRTGDLHPCSLCGSGAWGLSYLYSTVDQDW